ncbi:hypothetical protein COW99_05130 [Candidatus Roizmanbacteria bacterium CG22_combo_CG10-13_8_21_14_all_38_20]|uniref:Nucleotidyl transferase AbiEii/AbiGii toxin family protein n=1 Tax=Candidatus Roizmanbacteria bacterium CG22_combo_CG10-13_8_21_14_all_38_20 TaxID=1974862 RepID=A0A2H0BTY8_9BACT|nr:nucleotidyl transferase AbiEii/AbiGii toxin family protein [Candidatus Microgenomates bacterium]PIP61147.1 MAG: hypothetical protein COW99_05130 [Candidatus Roizmanbacteria bacterium CG22_combo_CG10-13_8_21_14_all_38_20]PJC31137.1 MAG: hypothetical protein CO050_03795 [Candidatus Roizmanbacteria bacterium CG_4_9_14_0_2_um_filter_38_17]
MEKVKFTKPQQIVVDKFKLNSYLRNNFYFTRGTALSVYYFGHRESEDLDFFTEQYLPKELVQQFVSKIASKHKLKFNLREIDPVLIGEVYMKIENFTVLPKMLVPLTLPQLQRFFKRQSRQLAKSFTK